MRSITCHSCGDKYSQIALHWNGKECEWPEFSEKQMKLMRGLLLGDADIKSGTNGSIFRLRMTNKKFLEWVSSELSPISRGVFLSEDSEAQKESALRGELEGVTDNSEFNDLYGVRTVTHPQVNKLNDWYSTGKKRYPESITKEMFRMWYVTDGWNSRNNIRVRCVDQSDLANETISKIDNLKFVSSSTFDEGRGTIRISSEDSREFFRTTSPPPGFEYKWP